MTRSEADEIIALLRQGKRLLISDESEELSSLLSIAQRADGLFDFNKSVSLLYDVVAPAQYSDKVISEDELRQFLEEYDYQATLSQFR